VRNPFANPEPLIRRVYAYVAYRIGDGPDAEDVTSDVFERALRYRDSYDARRGPAVAWLIGIARRAVDDHFARPPALLLEELPEQADTVQVEDRAVRRLTVAAAVERLDERDRELVALRYGADLTARQIGELLEMQTNAVEVALHRAMTRLRNDLSDERVADRAAPRPAAVRV
jgi:RNA polymerase sigma factor (sigma-70 family)